MSGPPPFRLFGPDHLTALAVIGLVCLAACRLARRGRSSARLADLALAGLILAAAAVFVWRGLASGELSVRQLLPLHLCDMLILVAIAALASRHPQLYEVLYYWACAGALLAMVTPIVPYGFPDSRFFVFFGFHGAVLVAAALLSFGDGLRPRPGSAWRVWLGTCLYAAGVAVANALLGTNYLFLRRKPPSPTLLDWLGPWPVYLGVTALVALALFFALERLGRAGALAPGTGGESG